MTIDVLCLPHTQLVVCLVGEGQIHVETFYKNLINNELI